VIMHNSTVVDGCKIVLPINMIPFTVNQFYTSIV
jgi:hypothetical protein